MCKHAAATSRDRAELTIAPQNKKKKKGKKKPKTHLPSSI
jgi:hypothetical protein